MSILDVRIRDLPWTANIPGFGLLSDDFPDPHLWISTVHDGVVSLPIGIDLPARVDGALFSAGDAHAVQGDGEVCGTGAETAATLAVRFDVSSSAQSSPWFEHAVRRPQTAWVATTGIAPDLFRAARDATRRAVDLVAARAGLAPIDAYLLLSLTGELRISEIVDAPNWVVSMPVPAQFVRPG